MAFIRSTIFLIYTSITSLALASTFFLLIFFGQKGARLGTFLWSKNCILAAKYILGITYVVKGKMPRHPVVFASRHESAWETAYLQMAVKSPVFILKRELLWIPFFNVFMIVAGYIGVNRSKGAGALKKMVKDAQRALKKGHSIIIFPEGTRVKPGERGSIKPGVIALYTMGTDIEIIPVSVNSGQFWGKNKFIKRPGQITITFHEPIKPEIPKKQFAEKLSNILTNLPDSTEPADTAH